jgi:hypothetical protein
MYTLSDDGKAVQLQHFDGSSQQSLPFFSLGRITVKDRRSSLSKPMATPGFVLALGN